MKSYVMDSQESAPPEVVVSDSVASEQPAQTTPAPTEKQASSTGKKILRIVLIVLAVLAIAGVIFGVLYETVWKKKSSTSSQPFTIVQSQTVPSGTPGDVTISAANAPLYGYFNTSETFASGLATYDSQTVATIASPSAIASDPNGNYWFPISVTGFATQTVSAQPVTLTLTDSSGNPTKLQSSNNLALNLMPQLTTTTINGKSEHSIFMWDMQAWDDNTNATAGSLPNFASSFQANVSTSGSSGSFRFIPTQSSSAGSTWSGFDIVVNNICTSKSASAIPLKFYNTGATKQCWTGAAYRSVLSASSCIQEYFFGFQNYPKGTGPYLLAPGTSAGSYIFSLNDNSGCS